MARSATLLLVLTVAFTLGAIYAHADDAQDIRELIIKENVSHHKGDVNEIMSCYAPDAIIYWQMSDNPEDILIAYVGSEEIRKNYAENAKKRENTEPSCEVRHVNVNGNCAVAVSRHWKVGEVYPLEGTHHSQWTLKKIGGAWKITSATAGVKRD